MWLIFKDAKLNSNGYGIGKKYGGFMSCRGKFAKTSDGYVPDGKVTLRFNFNRPFFLGGDREQKSELPSNRFIMYQLKNITIYAGNRLGGSTDTATQFKGPGNGTVTSLKDDAIMGYKTPTASLQYNRHTFPYNTPFYVTNRVRGREPFFNSYNDFIGDDIELLGRDYTIFPEYRLSENFDYYLNNYGNIVNNKQFLYKLAQSIAAEDSSSNFESGKIVRFNTVDGIILPQDGSGLKANSFEILGNLGGIHFFPTFIVFFCCMPMAQNFSQSYNWTIFLGFGLCIIGVLLEIISDKQLHAFRKIHPSGTGIIETGLWNYSRHPNYYGEIMFWWGIFVFGFSFS